MGGVSRLKALREEIFSKRSGDIHTQDAGKRNARLAVQLFLSFGYKGFAMLLSFAIVPLSINLLGNEEYGLWLTIYSLVNFFLFFDLGLGNGLKNKITIALTNNNVDEAKKYITTGYAAFGLLTGLLIILFFLLVYAFGLASYINTSGVAVSKVQNSFLIIGVTLMLSFAFNFVYTIASSNQRMSFGNFGIFLNNLLTALVLVVLNVLKVQITLTYMAVIFSGSLLISMVAANIIFYTKNTHLIPSVKFYERGLLREIFSLSFGFFIVQIQIVIISFTDTIIINKTLGNYEVTRYNLVYKLFNAVIILLSLISMPLWTVFTEAFEKKDNQWIKNVFRKFNYLMIATTFIFLMMGIFMNQILYIWVHQDYHVSYLLIGGMVIYNILYAWNYNFYIFLNSISEIKVQLPYLLLSSIINIPLCLYFIHLGLGSAGVVLASALCVLPFSFLGPYWAYRRIKHNV